MTHRLHGHTVARRAVLLTFAALSLGASQTDAQDTGAPTPESLIDKLTGEWVMTGTIDAEQVVHDVKGDWILGRRYLRIHDVSREKEGDGGPVYEAWLHIAWDEDNAEFVVMWLDNTGTTNFAAEGVGHGRPDGDRIPFVWRLADGSGIRNTFAYERASDTWAWTIDNVDKSGNASPFARVTLRRK